MAWALAIWQSAAGLVRPIGRSAGSPPRALILLLLAAAVSANTWGPVAWADSGMVIGLPQGTVKPKSGLRMNIDTRWVDANGYRPVRVEAINWPPGPTRADRSFRIVLTARSYVWGARLQTVTQYLELPQGAARTAVTMSVPQDMLWNSMQVQVFEDGRHLEDLDASAGIPTRSYYWSEAAPAILFIDSNAPSRDRRQQLLQSGRLQMLARPGGLNGQDVPRTLPDLRYLAGAFPNQDAAGNATAYADPSGEVTDLQTLLMIQDLPRFDIQPPGELPDKWIDFTCFDLICIRRADLQQLVQQWPRTWEAMRDWLATGPTLCVYDMPIDATQLAKLDRLLDLPPGDLPREGSAVQPAWSLPRAANAEGGIRGMIASVDRSFPTPVAGETDQLPVHPDLSPAPFAIRRVELGRVAGIGSDDPFAGPSREVDWLFNELHSSNWMWYQRHGISMHRENADYWNLIVPGVGRAPVGAYLVLITLFVVVIGPLNYYWLRKTRRLYLLLLTVPAGAALLTLALLNYALFTDGLGVRVRVRSYTQLDQRTQRGVSWSRQSYYAGLAPSGGLAYPSAAAVYPIQQYPADSRRQRSHDRRLRWDGDQHLVAGYLTARATSQFMVVHACRTQCGLVVNESAAGDAPPAVQNRLGAEIVQLVLRDAEGRLYGAARVAGGGAAALQPIEASAAADELKRLFNAVRPEFPEGYDSGYYRNAFGFDRYRYSSWMAVDQNLTPANLEQGVLERNLRASVFGGPADLPPRSYLAVTASGVEAPLGYSQVMQEAGFHLVRGQW